MSSYLSFGGGVNSVAMMLHLLSQGGKFESVFVDHGTDWPETYQYLELLQTWLVKNKYQPITVLKPDVEGFNCLYDFCFHKKIIPSIGLAKFHLPMVPVMRIWADEYRK